VYNTSSVIDLVHIENVETAESIHKVVVSDFHSYPSLPINQHGNAKVVDSSRISTKQHANKVVITEASQVAIRKEQTTRINNS
jgi:hypothetical protein